MQFITTKLLLIAIYFSIQPGKEDDKLHRSAVPRYAQSMRVERSNHTDFPAGVKSQSVSAAVSRSRSCLVHPNPAELERKHSHVRRKSTGLFSSKPLLKVPRIDNAINLFLRLQATLRFAQNSLLVE